MSGEREPACYDVHGVMTVRTNTRIVPALPRCLRVKTANPTLDVVRTPHLDPPPEARVQARMGSPGTCDLGEGEVFYEVHLPLLSYLGFDETWRFCVKGLADEKTTFRTAVPFYRLKPIGSRVTELLSRCVYLFLNLHLWRRGYALFHASAVARGDEAFVFSGYIGSGKTSTSLALMEGVCDRYLADDATLVDGEGSAYCWPEAYKPHAEHPRFPLFRFLRRDPHRTGLPDYPIQRKARARALFFVEAGSDEAIEIDKDEALRRALLVNADEISRFWNSPAAQIVNQYAYFYPEFDLGHLWEEHATVTASFVDALDRCFVLRSDSPRFPAAVRAIEALA